VPILAARKVAHARGVDVEVIVDKASARQSKSGSWYSAATYLTNADIPVWVETKVAIAHSKVMIIDGATVISGSFNFTAVAKNHNAENLLVLDDPSLAAQYKASWARRRAVSVRYGWLAGKRHRGRRIGERTAGDRRSCIAAPCRPRLAVPRMSESPQRHRIAPGARLSYPRRRARASLGAEPERGAPRPGASPSGRRAEGRRIPLQTAPRLSQAASTSRRRRSRMRRICLCPMIRRWRQSTRPIGSGGGRCRRLMWVRCNRQRPSRPNSCASLGHWPVASKIASGAPLACRRAGSQPGEECSFGRPLPFLYLPLARRRFAAPRDLRQAPMLGSVLSWEFRPMTPYDTAPVGVRPRTHDERRDVGSDGLEI